MASMQPGVWSRLTKAVYGFVLSVPVSVKVAGIMMLPVLILGFSLNYWITSGLSDWLSYLLTDVRVRAAMDVGQRSVTLVTVLAAAASILMAALLTFLLTRPLQELRTMALKVAGGDLNARAPVYSSDEVGEVARAINTMTGNLVQAHTDLTRSNRRLTAINRVILAAERDREIHDVLYVILGAVLDALNLEMGWVYLRDPDRGLIHLASWRNVPGDLGQALLHAPDDGLCLCQRMLLSGELGSSPIPCACDRMSQAAPAVRAADHLSMIIGSEQHRLGMINLVLPDGHRLSEDDRDLLAAIGAQVSEVVSNTWLRMKLAEKEQARQDLLESLVEAQEEERGRLARELHDGAGQMLTSLLVRLKTLEKQANSPDLNRQVVNTLDLVSETIEQVRDLSYRLRPAALEELGLAVALQTLVEDMLGEAGIAARCRVDLAGADLPHSVEVSLYRIAQEALTNVVRHANASAVDVELSRTGDEVLLQIRDDGRGFVSVRRSKQDGRRHLGLVSMGERAAMVNGALQVDSAPGKGTTVRVRLPIRETASTPQ